MTAITTQKVDLRRDIASIFHAYLEEHPDCAQDLCMRVVSSKLADMTLKELKESKGHVKDYLDAFEIERGVMLSIPINVPPSATEEGYCR